ncbi:hypothetical protein P153DRAFT_291971 [Dothidotthia symphoricarpi CBS 119687]|uniref:Peptidase S9 prolyl oligopeptidase catalytic domain-containing protein n=1 Tax=Dothidotthia symphoricarpi CBS 119687 TaxID=1392245 RepID=A0A6A6ADL4_9PLEO|nr:uncharacterized protein P153DRAFT_291971 [Dothidotthia symphoricarpi CBS 119687]KAF2129028.1 hypothetical protein P153DRAFT_291971 [Dothidotthia symphoricarpi CBS 119687]
MLSFSNSWQVLGPFQIGTREATWGADPLEYVGGFRSLQYDPDATFRSSIPTNGTAKWNITNAVQTSSSQSSANASLSISYSDVDWDFLKTIYGWAASQYQAWARGELIVSGNKTQRILLNTDAVLEYWVDGLHYYGGDFYTYRKAPPVLHLTPGSHKIDLRLVRDTRAFGGILEPTIDVVIDVQQVSGTLELAKSGILMSDVVDGKLATPFGSIYLRNSGEEDIEVIDIHSSGTESAWPLQRPDSDHQLLVARRSLVEHKNGMSVMIVGGQTRPVAFNVSLASHNASSVSYTVTYKILDSTHHSTLQVTQELNHVSIFQPHKITFFHPGGMLSYAMLQPPAKNVTCHTGQSKLPVLLDLHGAGVEADDPELTGALDSVRDLCAWVLFPTGVTLWSGDDWHNWGLADVEAAIGAIPAWIQNVGWSGLGVDTNRWIVSGHSNGGQGAWFALTHHPDSVLAAAPVSGYASIQKYVPYELWQPADPRRTAVISASLNSYRHEMLMANARGIPIQQQHGGIDDNVPTYHSRLLAQQLYLAGTNSNYNEVPEKNHWWDGIMATPSLVDFYHEQTRNQESLPRKLHEFTIVVGDPGDMGSKSGVRVTHLEDPGQYGRVNVKGHDIKTSNVQGLEFDLDVWRDSADGSYELSVTVDGQELQFSQPDKVPSITAFAVDGTWAFGPFEVGAAIPQRRGRQLGSMTAILRTNGPFIIQHTGAGNMSHVALQISRNLHQYFQADTIIVSPASHDIPSNTTGNVITLVVCSGVKGSLPTFPVQVSKNGVSIRDYKGRNQQYNKEATGAAFLQPLDGERLELVLWGANEEGLQQAARLVPMLTGVGQPDFVVLGESAKWKGVEGVLAMGFFDSAWEVTASSVLS